MIKKLVSELLMIVSDFIRPVLSLSWSGFVSLMRSGVGVSLSVAYISVSAIYIFWLYPLFAEGVVTTRPFFELTPLLLSLLAPTLTSELIAGERRAGRLDSWLALPLSYPQLLLGRVGGAWLTLTLTICVSALLPLSLARYAELPWGVLIAGYLGALCLSTQLLCIGLWATVRARSPLGAWFIGFVIALSFYLIGFASRLLPPDLGAWCQTLSLQVRFEHLTRGVIDSRDLIYFLVQAFFWFTLSVEALRAQVNRRAIT